MPQRPSYVSTLMHLTKPRLAVTDVGEQPWSVNSLLHYHPFLYQATQWRING